MAATQEGMPKSVDTAAAGTAVILSSHLLELIEELADRLLILSEGRCAFEGTIEEARRRVASGTRSSLEEIFMAVTEGGGVPAPEKRAARFAFQ